MIRDEFNVIEVTNEKHVSVKEFGKTQKTEYSFHNDNKIPEGELNEKFVGKTVKKVTEVNVEYTSKVPNHGITVVKSTTTATNVAVTTTSVAAVASTVAITAIAVATGISVAVHDYKFNINSFLITSNEISYCLTIVDNQNSENTEIKDIQSYQERAKPRKLEETNDEEVPFLLHVYNNNYDSSQALFYGYNEGSFSNLTLGDTYNIVLTENRYGGETIFSESFTTYKNSVFRDFNVYSSSTYLVASMNYLDELEKYGDFHIVLTAVDNSDYSYAIPLEATNETQSIDLTTLFAGNDTFDFSKQYNYQFSFYNGEETILFDEGLIAFDYTPTSVVRGVNWDKTADFVKKEFYVALDYQDDFNYFDQFELTLQDKEYPEEVSETFPLLKQIEPQPVRITDDSSIYLRREYYYMFTYQNTNTGMQEIIDSGEVKFTDISDGRKQFNGIAINLVPDYQNRRFYVTLDYVDDFEEYAGFHLILTDASGAEIYISLDETTDSQPINVDTFGIDFTKTYDYTLYYYDMETGEDITANSGTIEFDNSGATTSFNAFIFDETANYEERSFVVQLDYQDDAGYFDGFEFILTDQENGQVKTYALDGTTEPQLLYCNDTEFNEDSGEYEYTMDVIKDNFSYAFRYFDKRENDYVIVQQKEFTFQNSIVSEFTSVESPFDFTPEGSDSYLLPIKFNFDNKANSYTGFMVSVTKDGLDVGEIRFEGDNLIPDWQYGVFVPLEDYSLDDIINTSGVELIVTAYQDNINYPHLAPELIVYSKEVIFTKEQVQAVYQITIIDDQIHNGGEIMLGMVYSGTRDNLDCKLILEAKSGTTYTFNIMLNGASYSYVLLSETDDGNVIDDDTFQTDFIDNSMKVSLSYSTYSNDGTSADGEWSEYITKVIYDSYQFVLSV